MNIPGYVFNFDRYKINSIDFNLKELFKDSIIDIKQSRENSQYISKTIHRNNKKKNVKTKEYEKNLLRLDIYQDVKHPGSNMYEVEDNDASHHYPEKYNLLRLYFSGEIFLYLHPDILSKKYWGKQYNIWNRFYMLRAYKSDFDFGYCYNRYIRIQSGMLSIPVI